MLRVCPGGIVSLQRGRGGMQRAAWARGGSVPSKKRRNAPLAGGKRVPSEKNGMLRNGPGEAYVWGGGMPRSGPGGNVYSEKRRNAPRWPGEKRMPEGEAECSIGPGGAYLFCEGEAECSIGPGGAYLFCGGGGMIRIGLGGAYLF